MLSCLYLTSSTSGNNFGNNIVEEKRIVRKNLNNWKFQKHIMLIPRDEIE